MFETIRIKASISIKIVNDYHKIEIDKGHELYSEPLVPLSEYNLEIDGNEEIYLRKTVANMLVKVNEILENYDFEVLIRSGWRDIKKQQKLWDMYFSQFREHNPDLREEEIIALTKKQVADPRGFDKNDYRTWPTHSTGGAVDLTLCYKNTKELADMGAFPDKAHPSDVSDWFENLFDKGDIGSDNIPLKNRRILHGVMEKVGFVNYLNEFWHFDWGTQMYIMNGGNGDKAWYGYIDNFKDNRK